MGWKAECWVSSWPAPEGRGGWTLTDSPFIEKWVRIHTDRASEGGEMVLRFRPLSAEENPNARSRAGWAPRFRRALKMRLRFSTPAPPMVTRFRVFGLSRWNTREVLVQSGLRGKAGSRGRCRSI
jgi:hypothetical protein